jgi:rhodanese-related sulfurtransferase
MPPRGEHAGSVPAAEAIGWGDAALWVDARTEAEFAAGHWPGAVLLNEDAWNELVEGFLERWEPGKKVAVYCSDSGCRRSEEVARRLRQEVGLEEVWSIRGGWEAMGRSRQ